MDKVAGVEGSRYLSDDFLKSFDPDLTAEEIGPAAAEALRHTLLERERHRRLRDTPRMRLEEDEIESMLRAADYYTSAEGSTEDLIGKRRALMDLDTEKDREIFQEELEKIMADSDAEDFELGNDDLTGSEDPEEMDEHEGVDESSDDEDEVTSERKGKGEDKDEEKYEYDDEEEDENEDEDEDESEYDEQMIQRSVIKPHHNWTETLVKVDRVQQSQRAGTKVKYRCLVVGGNLCGAAGFGVGKATDPEDAAEKASRLCKRNVFFVDRYLGSGLTRDLVGKHNSCKVYLRARPPGFGIVGHDLVEDILLSFGISDCSCKTHGNRNVYSVVRATFKALATHESLEEIAMRRGKRLVTIERARRLQL